MTIKKIKEDLLKRTSFTLIELLVVIVNGPHRIKETTVRLNLNKLNIRGSSVLVSDCVSDPDMKLHKQVVVKNGFLEFKALDVSKGPRIFLIKGN